MKRVLVRAALCALILSGCAAMPANDRPVVSVVGTEISVDPDPLTFRRAQGPVMIIWRLDDRASGTFADNGIEVEDKRQFECRIVGNGRQFQCLNKNERTGQFKYVIRVRTPDGRVIEKDPHIVNAE